MGGGRCGQSPGLMSLPVTSSLLSWSLWAQSLFYSIKSENIQSRTFLLTTKYCLNVKKCFMPYKKIIEIVHRCATCLKTGVALNGCSTSQSGNTRTTPFLTCESPPRWQWMQCSRKMLTFVTEALPYYIIWQLRR